MELRACTYASMEGVRNNPAGYMELRACQRNCSRQDWIYVSRVLVDVYRSQQPEKGAESLGRRHALFRNKYQYSSTYGTLGPGFV